METTIQQTEAQKLIKEFKIDAMKGSRDGTVSSQWHSRPDDQRFLSLGDLEDYVRTRSSTSSDYTEYSTEMYVEHSSGNDSLYLISKGNNGLLINNWSFNQLCNIVSAPAGYLNRLPSPMASKLINHGLDVREGSKLKMYRNEATNELLAVNSASYGRIMDSRIVEAVRKIAGNGTGDTRWKVPGAIDWKKGTYNPYLDITKASTTLYASDRDVFMFLVDDTNPFEIGKLRNGDPDYVFRGFYVWNSEVGSKTMGISTFLLRGVCQNRNLWGVEDKHTTSIRHTKNAGERLESILEPALVEYSNSSGNSFIKAISNAKQTKVCNSKDDGLIWLTNQGFVKSVAEKVISTHEVEEQTIPTSVWDMCQGITALARNIGHTDVRIDLEKRAAKLMAKAA